MKIKNLNRLSKKVSKTRKSKKTKYNLKGGANGPINNYGFEEYVNDIIVNSQLFNLDTWYNVKSEVFEQLKHLNIKSKDKFQDFIRKNTFRQIMEIFKSNSSYIFTIVENLNTKFLPNLKSPKSLAALSSSIIIENNTLVDIETMYNEGYITPENFCNLLIEYHILKPGENIGELYGMRTKYQDIINKYSNYLP